MADFADRSLGIGYTGGTSLLFACLMTVLGLWYWSERTISVNTVSTPRVEAFYWGAITFSQTLGTALGSCSKATARRPLYSQYILTARSATRFNIAIFRRCILGRRAGQQSVSDVFRPRL